MTCYTVTERVTDSISGDPDVSFIFSHSHEFIAKVPMEKAVTDESVVSAVISVVTIFSPVVFGDDVRSSILNVALVPFVT
jgi:hypothetical protein